jgi:hypothetical protein
MDAASDDASAAEGATNSDAASSHGVCLPECPLVFGIEVTLTNMPGVVVSNLEAVLTGPVNATMVCPPVPTGSGAYLAVVCGWPPALPTVMGTYSLQVSAPGYQTNTIQVEVTTPPRGCFCTPHSIQPSTVFLGLRDSGSD